MNIIMAYYVIICMYILKWIFRKWHVGARTGLIWLRIGTDGGHL
jgi:hypothetical protein